MYSRPSFEPGISFPLLSKGILSKKYLRHLFKVEEETENLSYEEKKKKRQEASNPILDAFWSWIEKTASIHTTSENLTKALAHAVIQKKDLETFLGDGRIPLSNNLCEANIKPSLPNNNHLHHPEHLDQYLPWSKELPNICRLTLKHKNASKNDAFSLS